MKSSLKWILLCLFILSSQLFAQEKAHWPTEIAYIPDWEVELFEVDPAHSELNFEIDFFELSSVEGSFDAFWGSMLYNEKEPAKTSITLSIKVKSINTGNSMRDKDLLGPDFFDEKAHRFIEFQSESAESTTEGILISGKLKMKGIERELSIPISQVKERFVDPFWGNTYIGFKGSLSINRTDFGIAGGNWGDKVLSDEVQIYFSIIAQQPNTFKRGNPEMLENIDRIYTSLVEKGAKAGKQEYLNLGLDWQAFDAGMIAKRLMQQHYFQEAAEFLLFLIEQFPKEKKFQQELGKAYLYLGDFEKSKAHYQQAERWNTEVIEVLRNLGK